MKKLLTLVLALVLVFAIAAPALAITGDVTSTTPAPITGIAPVELKVGLLTGAPVYSYAAVITASDVAANKAYIVNEVAFWYVGLNFNAHEADKTQLNMASDDYLGAVLSVSCDAFVPAQTAAYYRDVTTNMDYKVAGEQLVANAKKVLQWTVPNNIWDKDLDVVFFGQGVVTAKGVFKAELVKTKAFVTEGAPVAINVAGALKYNVLQTNWGYRVSIVTGDNKNHFVDFVVDTLVKGNVTAIEVDDKPVLYTVPVSNEGAVLESIGGLKEGTEFAALKAAYLEVMSFFGFNYNAKGALLPKHFLAKAATLNLKAEKAVQLYTADIVIPGTVEPPKTGDAASIMGFAMIVVAMIAAGVVVSRKVRA